jgi:excisionase family DNA binding protein
VIARTTQQRGNDKQNSPEGLTQLNSCYIRLKLSFPASFNKFSIANLPIITSGQHEHQQQSFYEVKQLLNFMNDNEKDFLTIGEVAESLRVSEATILRWLKVEKVSGFFRVGRQWRIRKKDFDELINYEVERQSLNQNNGKQ